MKVRAIATVTFEVDVPDNSIAYPGTVSMADRLVLEKEWLEEGGDYLISAMTEGPSSVVAMVIPMEGSDV